MFISVQKSNKKKQCLFSAVLQEKLFINTERLGNFLYLGYQFIRTLDSIQ